MCGFAGFLTTNTERSPGEFAALARGMADTLVHRGPDDGGEWTRPEAGIALAHRRLSIIDLSQEGHQPMASQCGRYWLVYNGEIYNHPELRDDLRQHGMTFRGQSDTEVLVAAISRWGFEETLQKCNGMFALAVWDVEENSLLLARDRLGIKPLYYGWCGSTFLFASELKALRVHPDFHGEIDRDALALYVQYNYIPTPFSIYRQIHKLPPAHMARCRLHPTQQLTVTSYWDPRQRHQQAVAELSRSEAEDVTAECQALIDDATRLRMRADVPWGAFLSGGIDSSLIVASMQQQCDHPIHTFTMGFEEAAYDEAPFARNIAEHLGTNHVEQYVTAQEARDVIPCLPALYDEPFADSSQIPTFLVSCLARRHVTVCLSGDGGDELFGGYDRYFTIDHVRKRRERFPRPLRGILAAAAGLAPLGRARVFQSVLEADTPQHLYALLNRHWDNPHTLVRDSHPVAHTVTDFPRWAVSEDFFEQVMWLDTVTYLPDDILTKVDRASMGVGLEVRVPLLDHRLVEFAWSLPLDLKIGEGRGKYLLRELLQRRVPRSLFERSKVGFGVPIGSWLRGPLRDWAEALLSEQRLGEEGFFDARLVRSCWNKHLRGASDWHYWLWDILMFQAWLEDARATR